MYQALKRLGAPPALAAALVGVAWGLWHAPLVLGGYNYRLPLPGECGGQEAGGPAALAVFTVYTVTVGLLLSALVERYGSVYPAAAGHGAVNGLGGVFAFIVVGPRLIAPPAGLAVAAGFAAVYVLASQAAPARLRGRG